MRCPLEFWGEYADGIYTAHFTVTNKAATKSQFILTTYEPSHGKVAERLPKNVGWFEPGEKKIFFLKIKMPKPPKKWSDYMVNELGWQWYGPDPNVSKERSKDEQKGLPGVIS